MAIQMKLEVHGIQPKGNDSDIRGLNLSMNQILAVLHKQPI